MHGTSTPILPMDADDKALASKMIDYWTTFAKTGNPNGNNHPEWAPFNPDTPRWMVLAPKIVEMQPVDRETKYQLMLARVYRQLTALKAMRSIALPGS